MKKSSFILFCSSLFALLPAKVSAQYAFIPTLKNQFAISNVVISWEGSPAFVLQSATNMSGPWIDITNAHSPFYLSNVVANQYFRLRGSTALLFPPRIDVPQPQAQIPLVPGTNALPAGATARLPFFDGDTFFVSLPVQQQTNVNEVDVRNQIVVPILEKIGFTRGAAALSTPPTNGVDMPVANFQGLAQDLAFDYAKNPGSMGPLTTNMLDVFLGLSPPSPAIDAALEVGEGMNYTQYVAAIERKETQFAFSQQDAGIPIEHTLLIASHWEGQGITSVWGVLFNQYNIQNSVVLSGPAIIASAVTALANVEGISQVMTNVQQGPDLVLLPYGTDANGITQMRYAYRMVLDAYVVAVQDVGPLLFWLDAENGKILKLIPLINSVTAQGRVFNRDPGVGTITAYFEVDPSSGGPGGQYQLQLAGVMNRVSFLGNNMLPSDQVSISDSALGSSSSLANFDQAPFNTFAFCDVTPNSQFMQQVNVFANAYRYYLHAIYLGEFTPFPVSPWVPKVQVNNCDADSGMSFGACYGYFDPLCPNYSDGPYNSFMNFADDNTIVAHECGHDITERLCEARPSTWMGAGACAVPVGFSKLHDLADFWADHFEECNCTGGWVAKNVGGMMDHSKNCADSSDSYLLPRQHRVTVPFKNNTMDPGRRFPEPRSSLNLDTREGYADGQIAAAALWQVRLGMRSKCRPSGVPQFAVRYLRALRNTCFFGMDPGISSKGIYRYLHELEEKMVDQWATSGSATGPPAFAHNGPHTTSKVTAGFAKAGVFLIPYDSLDGSHTINGGDAVIDIDDNDMSNDYLINGVANPVVDFLKLGATVPPTFQVWTGPRYRLDGTIPIAGSATFNNPAPCNSQFQVEVSTDMTFPSGTTITSGFITVPTDPTMAAAITVGYGTWTPSPAQWMSLQAGGLGTRIYYRARTRDAMNTNERLSTMPGNGLWTVPPPYAVITSTGASDY
jgi:hypothetical protein